MGRGFPVAGVRAVGAAGRGLGSSYAGSAGRRLCVRVGIRSSAPTVRGDPVARGVRGRALSLLRLPSSQGPLGPAVHVLWARVCGYGAQHRLSPWLVCPVRGIWCQAPSLGCPSSGAGSQGSAARVSRVRLVRAWGPSTGPIACALAGRCCALWGWRKGVPGEGPIRRREGRLSSGAPPPLPDRPPSGQVAGVRCCAVGAVVRVWGPSTVPLACTPCGGCVPRARWGAAVPWWPATVVRGVWRPWVPSLPRSPALWGGQHGFCDPYALGVVDAGGAGPIARALASWRGAT